MKCKGRRHHILRVTEQVLADIQALEQKLAELGCTEVSPVKCEWMKTLADMMECSCTDASA